MKTEQEIKEKIEALTKVKLGHYNMAKASEAGSDKWLMHLHREISYNDQIEALKWVLGARI